MAEEPKQDRLAAWAFDWAEKLAPEGSTSFQRAKIAVGLIQARALECRNISGQFSLGSVISFARQTYGHITQQTEAALALYFDERSAIMERSATGIAEEKITEENTPKVTLQ